MVVSDDLRRAVVGFYQVLSRPAAPRNRLRLRELDPKAPYRISAWPAGGEGAAIANAGLRGGDDLMNAGLQLDPPRAYGATRGDFWARLFVLQAEA